MADITALARAKRAALGRVPLFQLSREAADAKDALYTALNEELERLQSQYDRQSQKYRDADPHAVGAWLEDLGNIADALEWIDTAAPRQWELVSAELEKMEGDDESGD